MRPPRAEGKARRESPILEVPWLSGTNPMWMRVILFFMAACLLSSFAWRCDLQYSPQEPAGGAGSQWQDDIAAEEDYSKERSPSPEESVEEIEADIQVMKARDKKVAKMLLQEWDSSPFLNGAGRGKARLKDKDEQSLKTDTFPAAPHLQDCEREAGWNERLDTRGPNGEMPMWSVWGGVLGLTMNRNTSGPSHWMEKEDAVGPNATSALGPYPPWIVGSDEENLVMTRRVQKSLWVHQHPRNCSGEDVRFLYYEMQHSKERAGMGAQLNGLAGALSLALDRGLILVVKYWDRADHDGCAASVRGKLACYFLSETSEECQRRAEELARNERAEKDVKIFFRSSFGKGRFYNPYPPKEWLAAWQEIHPTSEAQGQLVRNTRKSNHRWWRSQAVRYFLRFRTAYTCRLLNHERHRAFGKQAAALVARSLPPHWPKSVRGERRLRERRVVSEEEAVGSGELESLVWSHHEPWMPRPLVSMHVRQGDKKKEMRVAPFKEYMELAERLRRRFPHAENIWLSTEMEEVVQQSKSHRTWNFYFTNVTRQSSHELMVEYEESLGREESTNNAIVNLMMAEASDFFIGALGSTWCYLIDGMRLTGGKASRGYLSVNRDRFW